MRGKSVTERLAEVKPLLQRGVSYQEIADRFHITKQQIGLDAKKLGISRRAKRRKAYNGLKRETREGYILVYQDGKWVCEHRLVMEQYAGRKLDLVEVVHHINGNRADNRIKNLQLLQRGQHMKITRKERCGGCAVLKENRRLQAKIRELKRLLQPPLDKL